MGPEHVGGWQAPDDRALFPGAPVDLTEQPVHIEGDRPDWHALADAYEVRARRRRLGKIAAVAVAALVVVAGVSLAAAGSGADRPSGAAAAPRAATGAPTTAAPAASAATPASNAKPVTLSERGGGPALETGPRGVVGSAPGRTGTALVLDGSPFGYAQTRSPVVDTGGGFTVSAWVYNDASTESRSALSQASGSGFSFDLGREFEQDGNHWVFETTDATGVVSRAVARPKAARGRWTLLTGGYDPATHAIRLYVDGALAAEAPAASVSTAAPGGFQVGRLAQGGSWTRQWDGAVTAIEVWDRPLAPAEAALLPDPGAPGRPAAARAWLVP
ncbi:LamG domain-containing protein [Kitasatospora sp. NPDC093102]|uniref:LamG domain-containing protein n=1 Tax=Kitasatospora sp. NPDC093102 TaxID=3155069 RepID=UPI0034128A21